MKPFLIAVFITVELFASLDSIVSFDADFTQNITDDKNKTISYNGHIIATKPQNARWSYFKPVKKEVYINDYDVTIVEPEIEQVIIRKIESNFDFFKMIENAKENSKDNYTAKYGDTLFNIKKKGDLIESISYLDEFENRVVIIFKSQKQNQAINKILFMPTYPLDFDIIRD
ncbi:Outer membrane lipoprotein carrier protein LolA [Sulfurimonas denitrificans DSM 1251]|jgi:outer membrane lipoprotein carrier protein|uniref:Outer membrane lipoprotein carrier protein LolA n=1 Tax=Sulfurimonas denitrificans (strain ATCC 33889 / DSM 1251) TaxID=326298 RepID=Q30RR1_SULDN|nr:LolA-like outer membrane lipoprotein chaperone [Sulfurimonas denitrificans]ABB44320.1 Outer membrane lipoprotein carrier protein LolA [Sulfurimonas denitrificans DSM 1251]MDD3441986.1 LolA-like outer membrane lipoprotein chaperone [Sulfurimonas denitrificans]